MNESDAGVKKHGERGVPPWMLFLGSMALLGVGVNSYFAYVATRDQAGLVRSDYYDAALHWDQRRGREIGFDSLGINLSLKQVADTMVLQGLAVRDLDPAFRKRVAGFALRLELQRPDNTADDRDMLMASWPDSGAARMLRWRIVTSPLRRGKWECRAVFLENGKSGLEHSFDYFAVK